MSTEIIYDKQFVKLPDNKFIPMLHWGSNNCIQFDRSSKGRRERNWSVMSWICGGKQYATAEEILAKLSEEEAKLPERLEHPDDPDPVKSYGYYVSLQIGQSTRSTTFGMFKGLFVTGMKKALTLEQLRNEGVGVEVCTYYYDEIEVKEKLAKLGIPYLGSQEAHSTEHLMELLELYDKTYGNKHSWYVTFTSDPERRMKWIRNKYFPQSNEKSEYEYVDVDHYFTIEAKSFTGDSWYYFVKKTRYGFKCTYIAPYHKYATEQEAQKVVNRLKDRLLVRVTPINKPARVKVLKKKLAQL